MNIFQSCDVTCISFCERGSVLFNLASPRCIGHPIVHLMKISIASHPQPFIFVYYSIHPFVK